MTDKMQHAPDETRYSQLSPRQLGCFASLDYLKLFGFFGPLEPLCLPRKSCEDETEAAVAVAMFNGQQIFPGSARPLQCKQWP